jgi:hypothetical protein
MSVLFDRTSRPSACQYFSVFGGSQFQVSAPQRDTDHRCGCNLTYDKEQTIQTANIAIVDECVMSDKALRQLTAVQVTVTI